MSKEAIIYYTILIGVPLLAFVVIILLANTKGKASKKSA